MVRAQIHRQLFTRSWEYQDKWGIELGHKIGILLMLQALRVYKGEVRLINKQL